MFYLIQHLFNKTVMHNVLSPPALRSNIFSEFPYDKLAIHMSITE